MMTPARGRLITLEGIEGAGKSSTAVQLRERIEADLKVRCELTREPGGTPLAERLRDVLLNAGSEHLSGEAETLLMFAARSIHVEGFIRPRLAAGVWVVCDRFTDATRAYQGAGRGVDAALIEALAHAVHADLTPDLTLLFDLPVAVGLERAARRRAASNTDRFEGETLDFFERVRVRYLELAAAEPLRFQVLDATAPPESVLDGALRALGTLAMPAMRELR